MRQYQLDVIESKPVKGLSDSVSKCRGYVTYILPGQSLGPTENGCTTSLLSLSKAGSPSHRSGIKDNGSRKFRVEVLEQ